MNIKAAILDEIEQILERDPKLPKEVDIYLPQKQWVALVDEVGDFYWDSVLGPVLGPVWRLTHGGITWTFQPDSTRKPLSQLDGGETVH